MASFQKTLHGCRCFLHKAAALCIALVLSLPLAIQAAPQSVRVQMQAEENGTMRLETEGRLPVQVSDEVVEIALPQNTACTLTVEAGAGSRIEQLWIGEKTIAQARGETRFEQAVMVQGDMHLRVVFASELQELPGIRFDPIPSSQGQASSADKETETDKNRPAGSSKTSQAADALNPSDPSGLSSSASDMSGSTKAADEGSTDNRTEGGMDLSQIHKVDQGAWFFENPADLPAPGEHVEAETGLPAPSPKTALPQSGGLRVSEKRILSGIHIGQGAVQTNGVWRLSNGRMSFCGNYANSTPQPGDPTTDPCEVDSAALRKVLYYGYEGPANLLGSYGFGKEAQMIVMCDLVSQAYVGGSISYNIQPEPNWNKVIKPVWQAIQAKPDPIGFRAMVVDVNGTGINILGKNAPRQPLLYGELKAPGELFVMKRSRSEEIFSLFPSTHYSLQGAQFYVSRRQSDGTWRYITTLMTDASGRSETLSLEPATYKVEESRAPDGYRISHETWIVDVKEGQKVGSNQAMIRVEEEPYTFCPEAILEKMNARERAANVPSLAGAEFELRYFATEPATPADALPNPKKTWVYKTDDKGLLRMSDTSFVRGSTPYKDKDGDHVLPFGVLQVREIKAPPGYEKSDQVLTFALGKPGMHGVTDYPFASPSWFLEVPIGLKLQKRSSDSNKPLAGAEFSLCAPDGSTQTLTSGNKGEIDLHFPTKGIWRLQEVKAPKGYARLEEEIVLDVKAGSIILKNSTPLITHQAADHTLLVRNEPLTFDLAIAKVDTKENPLAGASFALYTDKAKTNRIASGTSDARGSFALQDLAPGKYYLCESEPPQGYAGDVDGKGKERLHKIEAIWNEEQGRLVIQVDENECTIEPSKDGFFVLDGKRLVLHWQCVNEKMRVLPESGFAQSLQLLAAGTMVSLGALLWPGSGNPGRRRKTDTKTDTWNRKRRKRNRLNRKRKNRKEISQ